MKKLIFLLCFSFSTAHAFAKEIQPPVLMGQEALQQGEYSTFMNSFEGIAKFTVYSFYNDPDDGLNLQFDDQEAVAHIVHDDQGGIGVSYDAGFPEDLKNIEARMVDINKIEILVRKWNVLTHPELKVRMQVFTPIEKSMWVNFQTPLTPFFNYSSAMPIPTLFNAPEKNDTLENWLSPMAAQIQKNTTKPLFMRIAIAWVRDVDGVPLSTPILLSPLLPLTEDLSARIGDAFYAWYSSFLPKTEGTKIVISIAFAAEQGQVFYINDSLEIPAKNLRF